MSTVTCKHYLLQLLNIYLAVVVRWIREEGQQAGVVPASASCSLPCCVECVNRSATEYCSVCTTSESEQLPKKELQSKHCRASAHQFGHQLLWHRPKTFGSALWVTGVSNEAAARRTYA